jgi:Flp pilus assembly protein CpaB
MMRAFISALVLLALAGPANALESMWQERSHGRSIHRRCVHKRIHHRREPRTWQREPVRPVIVSSEPVGVGAQCVERRIDVVSTPRQTIEDAKKDAQTQWRAKAQFLTGGVYMDPSLAESQKWLCSITDARDAVSGKLSEAASTVMGNSGELYRCYFSARPCRSDVEHGDE